MLAKVKSWASAAWTKIQALSPQSSLVTELVFGFALGCLLRPLIKLLISGIRLLLKI